MALDGLLMLVCAAVFAAPAASEDIMIPAADRQIAANLAVQSALLEGKQHLLNGENRAAVEALESQLPNINGNPVYLKLLQDAYRKYIHELRLAKRDEEAQRYLRRLFILDPGSAHDPKLIALRKAGVVQTASRSANENLATFPAPTIRLKGAEAEAGKSPGQEAFAGRARELLERAEQEFRNRHFPQAGLLYDQACQADRGVTELCRERWGYCRLYSVADRINHGDEKQLAAEELEKEVREGLNLAPKLETFGASLLEALARCRASETDVQPKPQDRSPKPQTRSATTGLVKNQSGTVDGWKVAETANFRIFHNQPMELVEKVAEAAERSRAAVEARWFAGASGGWDPKCSIYLHATGQDYSRKTGQFNSPGHSSIRIEGGRLIERRIDLHCDETNMLSAVLPHETTHIVLAGEFGGRLVPRWADEGMAVLNEPRERIDRHLNNLPVCKQQHKLYHIQDLMSLEAYPADRGGVSAFYAQSVSLVDLLASIRGEQEFTMFLREGMRYGYEKSLQRHYGLRSFADLERRWEDHAFRSHDSLTSLTRR
jgi:hypothetical protein